MNEHDKKFLNEIGGEPLEGSGFEEESDERDRRIAKLKELRAVGSLTCFVPLGSIPLDEK
jgi:hypothetical protein